jgi:hypothetical protein
LDKFYFNKTLTDFEIMRLIDIKTNSMIAVGVLALLFTIPDPSTAQITRTPSISSAQMTNVIPTNVFLTDDSSLFWYRNHERLVDVKRIEEAENMPESRPANQDPEGHWGGTTNGLQLALRFQKQSFTNGEPIDGIVLIRNVTNQPVVYFQPERVLATKDGKALKRKDDTGVIMVFRPLEATVFPQTQKEKHERLDQIYDLTQGGEFVFQAVCEHPEVASQKVSVLIKN